jgi:hypothetical protein
LATTVERIVMNLTGRRVSRRRDKAACLAIVQAGPIQFPGRDAAQERQRAPFIARFDGCPCLLPQGLPRITGLSIAVVRVIGRTSRCHALP